MNFVATIQGFMVGGQIHYSSISTLNFYWSWDLDCLLVVLLSRYAFPDEKL